MLPALTIAPVDVYRSRLYTADELYDATPYQRSLDAPRLRLVPDPRRCRRRAGPVAARPRHRRGARRVGRGAAPGRRDGRPRGRTAATRSTLDAARLGHALGAHHVVATGGGPGAMEAANLGLLRWPSVPRPRVDDAVAALAEVPRSGPRSTPGCGPPSRSCARGSPTPHDSLGIPTWHYGHEPSNVFATGIAKYFRNATREAILLEVCDAGIVFLPGAGGTVQEVFQDACENYYADESSVARDGAGRARRTGPRRCPPGRCCGRWPAAGPWRTACTSSTRSTRPSRWSVRRRARGSRSWSPPPRGSARPAPRSPTCHDRPSTLRRAARPIRRRKSASRASRSTYPPRSSPSPGS